VYEAVHTITGKPVAVKLMGAEVADTEHSAARFLREARAAAAVDHPAVVDVLDAGQEPDGRVFLALELLEGEDLATAIRRGDLSLAEITEIGSQVLEGLAAAHARGVIHRDIKPGNVFLTRTERGDLRVRLLDFGIAKEVETEDLLYSTTKEKVLGTPHYMSPEQMSGGDIDGRTDLWSVGALLFHALTGRPPFDAENYNMMVVQILGTTPPRVSAVRPEIPRWIAAVVDRALVHDVMERWQTAEQMASALRAKGMSGGAWDDDIEEPTTRMAGPFVDGLEHLAAPAVLLGEPSDRSTTPAAELSGQAAESAGASALDLSALRHAAPHAPADASREMRVFLFGALAGGAIVAAVTLFGLLLVP
jgi:serine/threonine-protein kinase